MKIQGYDNYKLSSPDYEEDEIKEIDVKIELEIHRNKIDSLIQWLKDYIINCDIEELDSINEDEGLYRYRIYGGWGCFYDGYSEKVAEINDLTHTLLNLGCEYAEVEENIGSNKVKEFLNLPKKKITPLNRMLSLIQSIKSKLVVEETNEVYESGSCCNKATFDSKVEALASIGNYRKNSKRPFRAYQCSTGKWHLSGTKKGAFNKIKK